MDFGCYVLTFLEPFPQILRDNYVDEVNFPNVKEFKAVSGGAA